ncbi:MAG TPA: Uma2 family endonuclease [Isosphaeraceae bacterium]|nr:Uma2 family endonuclease [Isosphaeraceae bacterium]
MATVDGERRTGVMRATDRGAGARRWRWNVDEYRRLDELGFFEDHKVELIDGELYELTSNPPHDTSVSLTGRAMAAAFGAGYVVREEKTLDLGRRFQPHPDVAVVAGQTRDYALKHPTTAALLVEVAESSLRHDRVVKAHRYAMAGIEDFWIVNLAERQLEIQRKPEPDPDRAGRFRYAEVTIVPADGYASPLARPEARVAVADLLP